jgi:glyoxylase-like metal-dependent hydrolase (beta-lactamase superfamily II)
VPIAAQVDTFFDKTTGTATHVVHAGPGSAAAVIDSVLDFDPKSGRTDHSSADRVIAYVREQGLTVEWLLETHVHADHLSAAPYLRTRIGGRIGIGARVVEVQEKFGKIFNFGIDLTGDGREFDRLFEDGDRFGIGNVEVQVIAVPGHTPADVAYLVGDAVFVGDTIFMPDCGSARADFPGGDARTLYRSAKRILELPPETRIFICHDYPPEGREVRFHTTVAEERAANKHLRDGIGEDEFVEMRTARDRTLAMPVLMIPSVQVNMRAGHLPPAEDNGVTYLKLPVNLL